MGNPAARGAWIVATSIGAVEALKDQLGFCRWNYPLRSLQHHARSNLAVIYPLEKVVVGLSPAAFDISSKLEDEKIKRREFCSRKVVELSSWGPSTVRF